MDGYVPVNGPECPLLRKVSAGTLGIDLVVPLGAEDVHQALCMGQVCGQLTEVFIYPHGHVEGDAAELARDAGNGPACSRYGCAARQKGGRPVLPFDELGGVAGEVGFHGFYEDYKQVFRLLCCGDFDGIGVCVMRPV